MRDFGLNKIFVEGKTDKTFIEALIKKYFNIDFNLVQNKDIVVNVQGKDKLIYNTELISKERIENKAKNLIIFDTDYNNKEGGRNRRTEELMNIANQVNTSFIIYLLPDDSNEGSLDDLVMTCFNKEFSFFEKCWNNMIICFNEEENLNLNIPTKKSLLYSYNQLFQNYRKLKEKEINKLEYNFLDDGIWNLDIDDNSSLKKLVSFIDNNLFIN